MIQTATLFAVPPLGSRTMTLAQPGDAAGQFADTFAQASDIAVPEMLAVATARYATRQDGAATGNTLPILALADTLASPPDPAPTPPSPAPPTPTPKMPVSRADGRPPVQTNTRARSSAVKTDPPAKEADEARDAVPAALPTVASPLLTDPSQDPAAQTVPPSPATEAGSLSSAVPDIATPAPRSRSGRRSQHAPVAPFAPVASAAEPANDAAPALLTRSHAEMSAATASPSERMPAVQPRPDTGIPRPTSSDSIASGPVTPGSVAASPRAPETSPPLSVGERDGAIVASPAPSRGSPSAMPNPRSPVALVRTLADALGPIQPPPPQRNVSNPATAASPASRTAGPDAPTIDQAPATPRLQAPRQSTAQPAGFTPRQPFTTSPMPSSTPTAPGMIAPPTGAPLIGTPPLGAPLMIAPVPPGVPAIVAMPSIVPNRPIADPTPEPATGTPEGRPTETPAIGAPRWTATDATTPVALAVARPDALQPQSGTVASAAQVFGAAIQAATKLRDAAKTVPGSADAALSVAPLAAFQEVRTTDAQQPPVDVRQERWPQAMIERIEILRDAADATDTRIRLIPDALGAIDVSLKTEGNTVHVHFNAEQAATRTLLQDAQPRLAELAEARGLKLAQGALGDGPAGGPEKGPAGGPAGGSAGAPAGGSTGGNAGSSQQRATATPHIPNRTAPAAAVIADATEHTRIA